MEKAYFTDLDSTIICSGVTGDDLVCVATKHGKNASFMRKSSKSILEQITEKIITVPITTRCEMSYNNIFLKRLFRHALVDNGAVLVIEDQVERDIWLNESYDISSSVRDQFDSCRKILETYGYTEKWGSNFVLDYVCKGVTESSRENLRIELEKFSGLLINIGKTSAVATFKCLSKGVAINRYAKQFGVIPYLSSGDNKEDESMFGVTQISIGKKNATYCLDTKDKLEFCDFVIRKAAELTE
ncbi:MAG: hypothetical protein Q4D02_07115 [Clostridia bacterium]|nr:hypothetical protein [Clostridia bacterium]